MKYFIEHSDVRKVVFWSSKIEELEHLEKDDDSDNDEDDVSDKDEDDGKHDVETVTNTTDTVCTKDNDTIECSTNVSNILSCDELLNVFEELGRSKSKSHDTSCDTSHDHCRYNRTGNSRSSWVS